MKTAINMSEAGSICDFPGCNLSFLNYILCVFCKMRAAVKRKISLRQGRESRPAPRSSHTCTEVKSPEAQAPRIAAPTRTDSTSCDKTTDMPVRNKATPWLGSRAGTVWRASKHPQWQKYQHAGSSPPMTSCPGSPELPSSKGFHWLCLLI